MKKFLGILVLVLLLNSNAYANNIEDFELEGVSIGGSLLDYFSEEEIINNSKYIYENKKSFSKDIAAIYYNKNLKEYDIVQIDFKINDKKFEIVGLSGFIAYDNDLDACYKKQEQVFKELKLFFKGVDTLKGDIEDHPGYPIGEVKLKRFSFFLNENKRSNLEIICFNALKLKDRLSVSLKSLEFNNWMFKLHK
jgi:hypothetical protein